MQPWSKKNPKPNIYQFFKYSCYFPKYSERLFHLKCHTRHSKSSGNFRMLSDALSWSKIKHHSPCLLLERDYKQGTGISIVLKVRRRFILLSANQNTELTHSFCIQTVLIKWRHLTTMTKMHYCFKVIFTFKYILGFFPQWHVYIIFACTYITVWHFQELCSWNKLLYGSENWRVTVIFKISS